MCVSSLENKLTFEGFAILMGAISGGISVLGTMIGHWFNRDKIKAEATLSYAVTVTELVGSVAQMTKMLQEQKDITDKRDARIDTLERETRERDAEVANMKILLNEKNAVIQKLENDMAAMMAAGKKKDAKIAALELQVNRLLGERETLTTTVDGLRTRLNEQDARQTGEASVVKVDKNDKTVVKAASPVVDDG